jgi:hypothetical protein
MSALARRYTNELRRDGGRTGGEFGLDDRLDIVDADEHVFGFEIGVDDSALGVEVVKAQQNLLRNLLDDMLRDAPVLIPLDKA